MKLLLLFPAIFMCQFGEEPPRQEETIRTLVMRLRQEAAGASQGRRLEIVGQLLKLVTRTFADQPVLLGALEEIAALEDRTLRLAYHAARARCIFRVRAALFYRDSMTDPEVLTWAREIQGVQSKILKELRAGKAAFDKL